eukprot:gene3698-1123_t
MLPVPLPGGLQAGLSALRRGIDERAAAGRATLGGPFRRPFNDACSVPFAPRWGLVEEAFRAEYDGTLRAALAAASCTEGSWATPALRAAHGRLLAEGGRVAENVRLDDRWRAAETSAAAAAAERDGLQQQQ